MWQVLVGSAANQILFKFLSAFGSVPVLMWGRVGRLRANFSPFRPEVDLSSLPMSLSDKSPSDIDTLSHQRLHYTYHPGFTK